MMMYRNISSVSQGPTNLSITVYHGHLSAHSNEFSDHGLHRMASSSRLVCDKREPGPILLTILHSKYKHYVDNVEIWFHIQSSDHYHDSFAVMQNL